MLLSLSLLVLSSCGGNSIVKPDPELCQPMLATIVVGDQTFVDPAKSYWFCVKRSDPHNTALQRRPALLDYVKDSTPIAISSKDYIDINRFEKEATDYVSKLEKDLDQCHAGQRKTSQEQAQ